MRVTRVHAKIHTFNPTQPNLVSTSPVPQPHLKAQLRRAPVVQKTKTHGYCIQHAHIFPLLTQHDAKSKKDVTKARKTCKVGES
jgi:hypothetical protein